MSYCTRSDVEAIFGTSDVAEWADLNNNDDAGEITSRINWAIDVAAEEFDDFFRTAGYRVPIQDADGNTPTTVKYHNAMLVGVLLYEWQGVQNFDPQTGQPHHKLAWHRQHVYEFLREVVQGTRKIDAV